MDNIRFIQSPVAYLEEKRREQKGDNEAVNSVACVRTVLLGKKVKILCRYHHVQRVMQDSIRFRHGYQELVGNFYGDCNLLTTNDKKIWKAFREKYHAKFSGQWQDDISSIIQDQIKSIPDHWKGSAYEMAKSIVCASLFRLFCPNLQSHSFKEWKRDHSRLLDAVATLDNLGIPTRYLPFWPKTFKRGREAKVNLNSCLDAAKDYGEDDSDSEHLILFTSSLVTKCVASLISSIFYEILNPIRESSFLALQDGVRRKIKSADDDITDIIFEVLRLQPPILGAIRQVNSSAKIDDICLNADDRVWLAIVEANLDKTVYGSDAHNFDPQRWSDSGLPPPLTFGLGERQCIGRKITIEIAKSVLKELINRYNISAYSRGSIVAYFPVRKLKIDLELQSRN